ncbi:MAG: argininosuccinate lyase [Fimbriimonadia bacterium]
MKKLIAQLLAVLVLASSVALIAGCGAKEEPAAPEPGTGTETPGE